MLSALPTWARELAWVSEGDEVLPSEMDGINVVLNRARLANYLAAFAEDRDVRDLLVLDVVANAAGLPLTSTGLEEPVPNLTLRPFRVWEYAWLYKTLKLARGGMDVLDLGGPATHLSILAAIAGCKVTSIDINPEFVHDAQECARALNLPWMRSLVGDMRDLSAFPDEAFDVVLSCSVLEHLSAHDQAVSLKEVARVLRPGGMVGLTFDYGPPAPGANIYLPPPHDPPQSTADALSRYLQAGLELAGNPFSEEPTPGSLFHDERVYYTVASLFLVKPPVPDIAVPHCDRTGSVLGSLVLEGLPWRLHTTLVRTRALIYSVHDQFAQLRSASTGLSQDDFTHVEGPERSLYELTAILAARDQRIAQLDQAAEERLRDVHELTAVISARDQRVAELERVAEEHLASLDTGQARVDALQRDLEDRERRQQELTAMIASENARRTELEQLAEERLSALAMEQTKLQYALREHEQQQEALRNLQQQHHSAEVALAASIERQNDLLKRVVALENETLLKYLARRTRDLRPR